jgi:hypothetical protein
MNDEMIKKIAKEYQGFLKKMSTSENAWHATLNQYSDIRTLSDYDKKGILFKVKKILSSEKKALENSPFLTKKYDKVISAVEKSQPQEKDDEALEVLKILEQSREKELLAKKETEEKEKTRRENERKEFGDQQYNLPFGKAR